MKNNASDFNNEKDATSNVAKFNSEELMMEVVERQKRASNIIILNVNESKHKIVTNKIRGDKDSVKELLKDIHVDITNIKVFRLGKDQSKNRPLKVCFPSPQEAHKVLKMKKELKIQIKIFPDQTKAQREYFFNVKRKLQEYLENSENKTIKYINNIPTIVDSNTSTQNKQKN